MIQRHQKQKSVWPCSTHGNDWMAVAGARWVDHHHAAYIYLLQFIEQKHQEWQKAH